MIQFFCLSSFIVPASVTNINNSIVVKEGQDATLVCHGFGLPAPRITWSDAWNVVMEDKNIWQLHKINRNMTGQYSCMASNACGYDSKTVDIDVQCESISTLKCILQAVICTSFSPFFFVFWKVCMPQFLRTAELFLEEPFPFLLLDSFSYSFIVAMCIYVALVPNCRD